MMDKEDLILEELRKINSRLDGVESRLDKLEEHATITRSGVNSLLESEVNTPGYIGGAGIPVPLLFCKGGSTMSTHELEIKCRELRQLQALIDEAQAEAETIKDAIKAAMGTQEAIQAGEYKIIWKPVTTARVDTTALREALPDVAARFTKETTVRRFSVA